MSKQRRQGRNLSRNLFLLFLGATFVAVMAGLPLVATSQAQAPKKEKEAAVPAPQQAAPAPPPSDQPNFEQADRNKDGQVDKSEAGVVPGLSANFERADRNKDGKLDKEEFAKGLQILQVRR
jgi:hypothetical protein